jgi:HK97 family phage portal protein
MSWIARLFSRAESRATMTQKDLSLVETLGGEASLAGVQVSPRASEQLSAVFACVQVISESLASLPIFVYRRRDDGGREVDDAHPVARVLRRQPNDWQTMPELVEMVQALVLLRGNAYLQIVRDDRGALSGLVPLHPDRVNVMVLPSGRVRYDIATAAGTMRPLLDDEVLHLRDRSDSGIMGKSRLTRARDTIGTAIVTNQHAASTYANGASVGGVLKHPGKLSDDAHKRLRASLDDRFKGPRKAGTTMILEEAMSWEQIGVSPEAAELVESRRFSTEEIARIFRVPPPIIGDLTRANYSNSREMGNWFLTHTLGPWIAKWEAALERALFSEADRQTHIIEFKTEAWLRADIEQRYRAYATGLQWGFLSPDEVRQLENRNPIPDGAGKVFRQPMNTEPVGAKATPPAGGGGTP